MQFHKKSALALRALLGVALIAGSVTTLSAQTSKDSAAVRQAAMDYLDGFYQGDTTRLVRSIRPDVYKYGFFIPRGASGYSGEQMKWEGFHSYANGVKNNNRQQPATTPKKVELMDLLDQTAAVKVTAFWGTDYLLMGKYDGRWMISHVLWQSPPPKK